MIINGKSLLKMAPIKDMYTDKQKCHGVSHGLSEAGYDIRVKQQITFDRDEHGKAYCYTNYEKDGKPLRMFNENHFILASSIEEFQMPSNLVGVVHDKSTWARKGLSVFNTVIENGWNGFLTLELAYHGLEKLTIPAGAGIAQVLFSQTILPAIYTGKYENQADEPVKAKES